MSTPDTRPSVYLSVPSWDRGEHPHHSRSVKMLICSGRVRPVATVLAVGDFLLRARNRHLFEFLHHPAKPEFFFCVGSDIDFTPDYFCGILARNLPIVAGFYPVKEANAPGSSPRWCLNTLPGERVDARGLLKIAAGGTDFLCFRRDAIERMISSPRVLQYADDFPGGDRSKPHHHLFPFCVANADGLEPWVNADWRRNRLYSEDYYACRIARECGLDIYADTTGFCGHWDGRTRYPTNPPPSTKLADISANSTTTPEHGGAQ